MLERLRERGDTLIEVLFAFSIMSLVVVGALTLMNQGTVAAQRSLETTLVRQQIDAQAETLRFLQAAYVAQFKPGATYASNTPAGQWAAMSATITTAPASGIGSVATCPTPTNRNFVLDAVNARFVPYSSTNIIPATTFAQVYHDPTTRAFQRSEGIWIQGVRSIQDADTDINQRNVRYIDFHIYACWDSPGQGPPMTIGTIVRLYEPVN